MLARSSSELRSSAPNLIVIVEKMLNVCVFVQGWLRMHDKPRHVHIVYLPSSDNEVAQLGDIIFHGCVLSVRRKEECEVKVTKKRCEQQMTWILDENLCTRDKTNENDKVYSEEKQCNYFSDHI